MLFLTKGGITKSIRNLEKNGYIKREKSPEDGRQHIIKLTQKGKDIIPVLNKINNIWGQP